MKAAKGWLQVKRLLNLTLHYNRDIKLPYRNDITDLSALVI